MGSKEKIRVNDATLEQRVDIVIELILSGLQNTDIKKYIFNIGKKNDDEREPWGVGERQIENYIAKAKEYLRKDANVDRDLELAKAIKRYESLYSRCLRLSDFKTCATINEKLTNLIGVNKQKQEIELSGKIEHSQLSEKGIDAAQRFINEIRNS